MLRYRAQKCKIIYMNAVNYRKLGGEQIKELGGRKADILLHCCCAPCASACMEYLKDYFDITAYFYNPNIESVEYERRLCELERFSTETGWAKILPCGHDERLFYEAAKGLEDEKEGGARCANCFALRLDKTAEAAKRNGFEFITTTLTLSPLKDAKILNAIGEAAAKKHGVKWLFCDFKKQNGYLRSLQLSREHGLYRQNYCGCEFSKRDK